MANEALVGKLEALQVIREHRLATLGTIDERGHPYTSSIFYTVDDDFVLYFLTRSDSHKYQHLLHNPNVAYTITDRSQAITIQAQGTALIMPDGKESNEVISKLWKITVQEKHWPTPVVKLHDGEIKVIKIVPNSLRYSNFRPIHLEGGSAYVKTII